MTVTMSRIVSVLALMCFSAFASADVRPQQKDEAKPVLPGGALHIIGKDGVAKGGCSLKHTDVQADVTGFIARVHVKQTFQNPSPDKIEAIYVFPLPNDSAVDQMTLTVGDRKIVGQVKKREEARQIYEQAVAAGNVAGLLDQERPNIFTQSVANIEPGVQVTIEIGYTQTLKYEEGTFEFTFPMVVGPRYMPGSPSGKQGEGAAPDTTQVPDASKISPPITPQTTRAGHDISMTLNIDAGIPIGGWESTSHIVRSAVTRTLPPAGGDDDKALPCALKVTLKNQETIPNKDFVYRYSTASDGVEDAFLVHKDDRGQFFTLILQPPKRVERKQAVGRELCFVLDTSGSMQGFPITKAKMVMSQMLDAMGPQDSFNVMTFSGDTRVLWDKPRAASKENVDAAQTFLSVQQGNGGTEMMKAIDAALVKPPARVLAKREGPDPIRIAIFMTDGYVGNDMAIIDAVKKNAGTTRVFSFGIGNSVNRFLLDGMAYAGRGEVEYVYLESQGDQAARHLFQRLNSPVLTDVSINWGDLPVADVYPKMIPDLFAAKPVVVYGRLKENVKPGTTITLKGNTADGAFERKVAVTAVPPDASHEAIASLWARTKANDLMMRDFAALQNGNFPEPLKQELTNLGIEFRLMTQFTSFVAVEELTVTKGGKPTKVSVPVEMPDGISYEGIFGEQAHAGQQVVQNMRSRQSLQQSAHFSLESTRGGRVSKAEAADVSAAPKPKRSAFDQKGGSAVPADPVQRQANRPEQLKKVAEAQEVLNDLQAGESAPEPADKLDPSLRGVISKVTTEGKEGNIALGPVIVSGYKTDVMITLADTSEKTIAALKKLGFEQTGESKAIRLLIGTIDVRKLEDLAKLDAVLHVKPVPANEG